MVAEEDYSLNPARYVGFEEKINPDFDFVSTMKKLNHELKEISEEEKEVNESLINALDKIE